jgi:hypothetical protein
MTIKQVDSRYTPPTERDPMQLLSREMQASLAVGYHTGAEHEIGRWGFEQAGFAKIPRMSVTVVCKERDFNSLVPMLHRQAISQLAELGWSHHHLAQYPSNGRGRVRMFTDQNGARRRGVEHRVSFDLSPQLAEAINWNGYTAVRGTLTVRENGMPV